MLPVDGTQETFNAEAKYGNTHDGLQKQDGFVVLIDEYSAVYPEQGEMYREDESQRDYEAVGYHVLESQGRVGARASIRTPGLRSAFGPVCGVLCLYLRQHVFASMS